MAITRLNPNQLRTPNQNLLEQTSPERSVRPRAFYALIVLEVMAVALAFVCAFFYRNYLLGSASLLVPVAWGSLFAIVSIGPFFVAKAFDRRMVVIVLEALALGAPFLFFPGVTLSYLIPSLVVVFAVIAWGERESRQELENGMKIKFFRVVKPMLGRTLTAGIVFAILLYVPQWEQKKEFVSQSYFDEIFSWSMSVVKKTYPNIEPDSSLMIAAKGIAEKELMDKPMFAALDPAIRAREISLAAEEVLKNLTARIPLEVKPDEKINDIAYRFVANTLRDWYEKTGKAFLIGLGVLMFFVIRGVSMILYIPLSALAFLFYQTLFAMRIIHVSGESQLKEVIEYS